MNISFEKVIPSPESSFRCFNRKLDSFPFYWHQHDEYELTLIISGKGRRFVGDSIDNYDRNDLVLIGPNLPHTWSSFAGQNRCQAVVIQFGSDLLADATGSMPEFRHIHRLLKDSDRGLFFSGNALSRVISRIKCLPELGGLQRLFSLLELLQFLEKNFARNHISGKLFQQSSGKPQKHRIETALGFIAGHYDSSICLEDAAHTAHMSPAGFSRFFKRTTGKTFIQYTNELRISRACQLLISTDMPITQICFASGFQSLSNFNRRFRQLKELSPRCYRNQFNP